MPSTDGSNDCPSCGRHLDRGETQCQRCGEIIAVDPLGTTSPKTVQWVGRLLAVLALFAPIFSVVGAFPALGLWVIHDRRDDALQLLVVLAVTFGVGWALQGGLVAA